MTKESDGVGASVTEQYGRASHSRYASRFCDAPGCWGESLAWSNGSFLCETHAEAYGVIA